MSIQGLLLTQIVAQIASHISVSICEMINIFSHTENGFFLIFDLDVL